MSLIFDIIDDLKKYEKKSIAELKQEYDKLTDLIAEQLIASNTSKLGVSDTTRAEIIKKLETRKEAVANEIANLTESSKDTTKHISILINFANRIPELYLKATIDEKRLILNTITESITYDEDTNTLSVKLRPVFEHLRLAKQSFKANLETLDGTLQTRSERVKQTHQNIRPKVNAFVEYGTRKRLLNTKIEPNFNGSKKLNVEDGT